MFRDGYEMIKQLDSIIVNGGGDCPEFAADGILRGKHPTNVFYHNLIRSTIYCTCCTKLPLKSNNYIFLHQIYVFLQLMSLQ